MTNNDAYINIYIINGELMADSSSCFMIENWWLNDGFYVWKWLTDDMANSCGAYTKSIIFSPKITLFVSEWLANEIISSDDS